jgi:glycosyltransferase involved in cell wall biosynthesis
LKIAFYNVTATFIRGGLETYCWEVGGALAKLGHDVTIVAGNRGTAWHDQVRLVQFPFRSEKEWPDFGVRFRRLAERYSFARHSLRHLINENYDVVIVNKPFDFPILWTAARRGMRAVTFFRSGGTDFYPGDRAFSGAIRVWASSSGYNARQIKARYGKNVEVIHNGVDLSKFSSDQPRMAARARYNLDPDDVVLVSVGRLVGWKGTRVVVETLPSLPEHVKLVVAGTGPEEGNLKELARRLNLDGRVKLVGQVARNDLPSLLSLSDIFVQPSIGEEAFGISVVEAMACSLPVLASNNGGLPEIVVDGETGFLIEPGHVERWRSALARYVDNPGMRRDHGAAGRLRAEKFFSWEANARRHETLIVEARSCAAS